MSAAVVSFGTVGPDFAGYDDWQLLTLQRRARDQLNDYPSPEYEPCLIATLEAVCDEIARRGALKREGAPREHGS